MNNDYVEIRRAYLIPSLIKYEYWTKVSRFLAIGLQGIEIREIDLSSGDENLKT